MAAGAERYTPTGLQLPHADQEIEVDPLKAPTCPRHVLHDLRKGPRTWKTGKKVTEVKLKSFNAPTFFADKYILGTDRSVGHY